jgi:hypothetical protein
MDALSEWAVGVVKEEQEFMRQQYEEERIARQNAEAMRDLDRMLGV